MPRIPVTYNVLLAINTNKGGNIGFLYLPYTLAYLLQVFVIIPARWIIRGVD